MKMQSRVASAASRGLVAALSCAAVLSTVQATASACGGLFCNSRPPDPLAPLPVAQTGENVVFSVKADPDGGAPTLTAHIQILYAGDAAKFSWVVPVDSAPTLGVGTDRLFTTLATLTQPVYTTKSAVDGQCLPQPQTTQGGGPTFDGNRGAAGTGGAGASAPGATPGVMVSFQGAVGPFEAAVIKSEDPAELKKWLTDNGYVVSDEAAGLIDEYVRENKWFVALKLLNGVGVRSIQPIVLTFRGTEPCVPLKLTRIAANPDLQVRMWVLAEHRAVPKNFYEMTVDEARIDWLSNGSNYNALVAEAANDAGGNSFIAEYAGSSTIAARALWFEGQYDLSTLRAAMTPPTYVQALIALGLGNDTQTLPLLAKYIPMPDAVRAMGVTESQFYGNLSFYWTQYAFPKFDLDGLTADVQSKIIEPRKNAQLMIDAAPYLTRLNTFISPDEMNKDPLFILNKDLPEVPLVHTAVFRTMCGNMQFMACNAPVRLELADGRMAWVRAGSTAATCSYRPYDTSQLQKLPAADVVWQREESGDGTRIIDNRGAIGTGLTAINSSFANEQKMFPIPTESGGGPSPGMPGTSGGPGGNGCACTVGPAGAGGLGAGLAAAAVAAWALRKRRRSMTRFDGT